MEKDGIVFGSIAVLQTIVTVSQTNEVFQTIQIIISALAGAVALAYTIWRWYRIHPDIIQWWVLWTFQADIQEVTKGKRDSKEV